MFTVSRTAYADNSSVYHLNGKKLQFKEIAALLRESGIDLDHNRFLILQVHCVCVCACVCVCVCVHACMSVCLCVCSGGGGADSYDEAKRTDRA